MFDIHHISELAVSLEPTKRNVVSLATRIYGPLGILSPFVVHFEMLCQQLCLLKVSWDEHLSGESLTQWRQLKRGLELAQPIVIPRCYFHELDETSYCLLGFCDASKRAYAAVVYLRGKSSASGCTAKFVVAKIRVSPIQGHSIPRLELLAALLLVRLISSVSAALEEELKLESSMCYTDSKVALFWIKGQDKEWKQFVENRVIEIRQLVPVECWKHCPGEINPADLPSRGVELSELLCNSLRLNGRSCFHSLDAQITAESEVDEPVPEECLHEMKISSRLQFESVHNMFFSELHDNNPALRCEDFSTLRRLLRVTGCVQKFIERVKAKLKDRTVDPELSASDITAAELYWIKVVQKSLMKNVKFSIWKRQFGMYLDQSGVWRCRGRMENADLEVQAKCPIMLCLGHHFTTLFVLNCHQKVMHGGVKDTLTELRSRFWLVKGRSFVRKLIHQCMVYNKLSSKPYNVPPEPPLPSFRVREVPPFTYVGVDYAGPLFLKGSETKV